jgi:YjbE family integral membrane protein
MDLRWMGIVVAIVLVDLSLSGDNAVVIGAVASRLPPRRQRAAITFGILMAIVARIALAASALLVLKLPFVQAVGGVVVFLIAGQMVIEQLSGDVEVEAQGEHQEKRGGLRSLRGNESLLRASLIILLADVTMSLDNILAIVALAQGNFVVLALGFLLSMLMLLVASTLIARLIARFPILMYAAAGILAWTAGTMVLGDARVHPLIAQLDAHIPGPSIQMLVAPVFVAVLGVFALIVWLHSRRGRSRANAEA